MDAKAAPAAAAAPKPSATVEQCRVLQQVIKLLEHTDEAKKMLPLANMSPEMLQTTLQVRSNCPLLAPSWQYSVHMQAGHAGDAYVHTQVRCQQ